MKSLLYLSVLSCLLTLAQPTNNHFIKHNPSKASLSGDINDHDIKTYFNQNNLVTKVNSVHVPLNVDIYILETGKHVLSVTYNENLMCSDLNSGQYLISYGFKYFNPIFKKVMKTAKSANQNSKDSKALLGADINDHDISTSFNQNDLFTTLSTDNVPQNIDIYILETGKHVLSTSYSDILNCNELNSGNYLVSYGFENFNPVFKKVVKTAENTNQNSKDSKALLGDDINDHDISTSFNQNDLFTTLSTPNVPQNIDIYILETGKHVLSTSYSDILNCNELNSGNYLVSYGFENFNPVFKKVVKTAENTNPNNKNAKAPPVLINAHHIKTFFSGNELITILSTPHIPINVDIYVLETGKHISSLSYNESLLCDDLNPGLYIISYGFKYFNPVMKKVIKI